MMALFQQGKLLRLAAYTNLFPLFPPVYPSPHVLRNANAFLNLCSRVYCLLSRLLLNVYDARG